MDVDGLRAGNRRAPVTRLNRSPYVLCDYKDEKQEPGWQSAADATHIAPPRRNVIRTSTGQKDTEEQKMDPRSSSPSTY